MRPRPATVLFAACAVLALSGQAAAAGPVVRLAGPASGRSAAPAFHGKEVFKIVSLSPLARHPVMRAKGAFTARGYFLRRRHLAVFPAGRLKIARHVLRTFYYGPVLSTCRFKIWQRGTFRVVRATGRYARVREHGRYWTAITGRLKRVAPGECGAKIVAYRAVTFEIGTVY